MPLLHSLKNWLRNLKNERLYRRVDTERPVMVTNLTDKKNYAAIIANWSPAGVFVRDMPQLPLQTLVDLEFAIGDVSGGSRLKLRGQIVRHQGGEGMGVMFTDFTESGLILLREFLAKEALN